MGKQSAFAKAVQREVNIQLQLYGRNRMQLAEDAAFMAANEVLGLGSGRARAFGEAFVRYSNEIADLVVEDSKADDEIVYAKTVLDRRIREIVGTVTVNGKQYYCADTHEFLHFLEDIGERWEDSEIRKG